MTVYRVLGLLVTIIRLRAATTVTSSPCSAVAAAEWRDVTEPVMVEVLG